MKPFITEIQKVTQNGFFMCPNSSFEEVFIRVLLVLSTVDLQARYPRLSIVAPTGHQPCSKCYQNSVRVPTKKGGSVPFPIYRRIKVKKSSSKIQSSQQKRKKW